MSKISPKNIAEAIYDGTEGKSGQDLALALKRSVQIISRKRLLGKSEEVLDALQNIFDEKSGTVRAKVVTARRITDVEKHKIEHEIKEKYKAKHVIGEFFEKEELLGGIRVEVGDEVLDATYKNKLHKLEKFLIREL